MAVEILVVEDTWQVKNLIQKIICHLIPDAIVDTVTTGREALHYLTDHLPSLIITDLEMPEVDGYALMGALHDQALDIPIMILSSHALRRDDVKIRRELEARGLPAVPILCKPLDISDLRQTIVDIVH